MIIERAIKLFESLDEYYHRLILSMDPADKEAQENQVSLDDCKMLVYVKSILGLCFRTVKQIEKNAVEKTHGVMQKGVVSLEC